MKLAYLSAHSLLITYLEEPCVPIPNHPPLEAHWALGSDMAPGEELTPTTCTPRAWEPQETLLAGKFMSDQLLMGGWGPSVEPAMAGGGGVLWGGDAGWWA